MGITRELQILLTRVDTTAGKLLQNSWFYLLLILLTAAGFWITQVFSLELFVAGTGSSPLHWVYLALDPEKSLIDWPTGTRNLGKSLPMHIYRLSDEYLGADLFSVMKIYMAAEILAMLFSYYYFSRSTESGNSIQVVVIFSLIASLTVFQSMNLARFVYPFVWGLYYSFAAAARILGLALIFKNRPWLAMIAFALGVMTHPIMGMIGLLAGFTVILSRGLGSLKLYVVPTLCMCLLTSLWLWFNLAEEDVQGGGIPLQHWYELTKTFNYHWYPFYTGVFSDLSIRQWFPFLSILVLYLFIRIDENNGSRQAFEIDLIIIVLTITTMLGLVVSYFELSPFLMKLSLHRSSDLLVVVALLPVLRRLYVDALNLSPYIRVLSIVMMVSPVLYARLPGFPLGISLLYTATFFPRLWGVYNPLRKLVLFIVWGIALISLCWYLFQVGAWLDISAIDYTRPIAYFRRWGLVLLYVSIFVLLFRNYRKIALLLMIVWICLSLVHENNDRVSSLGSEKSRKWYETQLWARKNTAENSVFMLDPVHYGGWRDISRRASFGGVREWLHNAWLYDSDIEIFNEAVRRFELLGLSLDDIYQLDSRRERLRFLNIGARRKYYSAPQSWFETLSSSEGVDYFVFERRYLQYEIPASRIVFENKYFIVYSVH